jgi:quercetin 2,3-dioxygenase
MKKVISVESAPGQHWVGDGFPVRTLFSYQTHGGELSPFLLLDYGGPREFTPAQTPRGVGEHPHRGFETVTIVYQGEVEHRDSAGGGGKIGPGDVQWMTAGAGLLHEEFHSTEFTHRGGTFEVVQLWVNLPAAHKMTPPRYQPIVDADIPAIELNGDAGLLRVIAGDWQGTKGPAQSFTPMNVWDLRLKQGKQLAVEIPDGWTTAVIVLRGTLRVNGSRPAGDADLVTLSREGTSIAIEADSDSKALVLAGAPIDEPVVGYGPFVMNTREEIHAAIRDFNSNRFGRIAE